MSFRFLSSPFPWLLLILLFFAEVNLGLLPLGALAISQTTLLNPAHWTSFLTAGLTHTTFLHLSTNLALLVILGFLYTQKKEKEALRFIIRLGLLINILHGLMLAIIIQGSSFPTLIYGSSGIVCGLASFLWWEYRTDTSWSFWILGWALVSAILFSLLDIFFLSPRPLSSWSHLLGVLLGFVLSYAHEKKHGKVK